MMERYTTQQKVEIIKIYYRNSESVASTLIALRPIYGRNNRSSGSTIGFSVWSAASVPVLAMQKKLSFIHNNIERTSTAIKNFIDIENYFYFI